MQSDESAHARGHFYRVERHGQHCAHGRRREVVQMSRLILEFLPDEKHQTILEPERVRHRPDEKTPHAQDARDFPHRLGWQRRVLEHFAAKDTIECIGCERQRTSRIGVHNLVQAGGKDTVPQCVHINVTRDDIIAQGERRCHDAIASAQIQHAPALSYPGGK